MKQRISTFLNHFSKIRSFVSFPQIPQSTITTACIPRQNSRTVGQFYHLCDAADLTPPFRCRKHDLGANVRALPAKQRMVKSLQERLWTYSGCRHFNNPIIAFQYEITNKTWITLLPCLLPEHRCKHRDRIKPVLSAHNKLPWLQLTSLVARFLIILLFLATVWKIRPPRGHAYSASISLCILSVYVRLCVCASSFSISVNQENILCPTAVHNPQRQTALLLFDSLG